MDHLRKRLRETERAMERIVAQMAKAPLATSGVGASASLIAAKVRRSVTITSA